MLFQRMMQYSNSRDCKFAGGDLGLRGCSSAPGDTILADGFSFYPRTGDLVYAPYDYAVLFLSKPKSLSPYYQYNYLTNVSWLPGPLMVMTRMV
jgi:hypothetical protein